MKRYCIDDETFMDYLEGRLPQGGRERVEKHLCSCADCRDLFMLASELVYDSERHQVDAVPAGVTQRAVEAVTSLAKDRPGWGRSILDGGRRLLDKGRSLFSDVDLASTLQPAPLRGGDRVDDVISDEIIGPGFKAIIEIEKATVTHFTLQVEPIFSQPIENPLRLGLFSGSIEIASATLKDTMVPFEDIPNGKYTLVFSQGDQRLAVYTFEV